MEIKANRLSENMISMLGLKGLEYVLNFALLPILLRVLGPERFGAYAFMQGIIQYFIIITDYGFNMTAPRDIAKSVNNSQKVADIFCNVMVAKFILCCSFTMISVIFAIFSGLAYKLDIVLFFATYAMVVGNIIFPIWFFQGIQQMRYITIVNIAARFLMVAAVLFFVKGPEDYLLAAFLQSSVTVVAGIFSFGIIFKKYSFVLTNFHSLRLKETLKEGWSIFVSTIAINIYTTTTIVILGVLTSNIIVGYYSAANKVLDSIRGIMNTITQTIYPHVAKMISEQKPQVFLFLRHFFYMYVGGCAFGGVILFFLAWLVVKILFGPGYEPSINILKILAFVPFAVAISNVYGVQCLLNFGYQKTFSNILVLGATFNLLIVGVLIYFFQAIGAALSMLLTESGVAIASIYYVKKIHTIDFMCKRNGWE